MNYHPNHYRPWQAAWRYALLAPAWIVWRLLRVERLIACPVCGKKLHSREELNWHIGEVHHAAPID